MIMQPENRLAILGLAPVVLLGISAIGVASALGSGVLAFALGSTALVAAGAAAGRVIVIERGRAAAQSESAAQIAYVRGDRRRPTFDRETGLLAEWYFRQRFEEEIARARRYGHDLTALTITITSPGADALETARIAARAYLRQVDFAGDLGGVIGVCLPDTSREQAQVVVERLRELVPGMDLAARAYPDDGETASALLNEQAWHTSRDLDEAAA